MENLIPLSRWLDVRQERIIAVHKADTFTTRDFLLRVQVWIDTLHHHQGSRCAVYHSDTFEFLAILFALWQVGCTACVPGDNRPGTVQRLKDHVDIFVGEFSDEIVTVGRADNDAVFSWEWQQPIEKFIALEIYTSGSTGEPKPITKTLTQIDREIEVLESLWPGRQDCTVLSTVSHQHLYGMTFRLFWPFSAGQAFSRNQCEYLEDVLHHAKHYTSFSLISSPSHLARMNKSVNWGELAGRCQYIISSAAPLAREDSLNAARLMHAPVREIYGSSETGAVAWRIQDIRKDDALWQALPEVELSSGDGATLCVKSPYLGDIDYFILPDRVEFNHNGQFELMGRVDNIVKVEGKRVSLASFEKLLLQSALIINARALTLERKRIETAVVIQLSEEGERQLSNYGRKSLVTIFKNILRDHFEAVALPRRWRFVEEMPYNSQGKIPVDALREMFSMKYPNWPIIAMEHMVDGQAQIHCFIQEELIYFDGHFDGNPVLPGVVQIHWAEEFGRRLWGYTGQFKGLEIIKFKKIITPGHSVIITLEYDEIVNKLQFKYESDKGMHSSGRICYTT